MNPGQLALQACEKTCKGWDGIFFWGGIILAVASFALNLAYVLKEAENEDRSNRDLFIASIIINAVSIVFDFTHSCSKMYELRQHRIRNHTTTGPNNTQWIWPGVGALLSGATWGLGFFGKTLIGSIGSNICQVSSPAISGIIDNIAIQVADAEMRP